MSTIERGRSYYDKKHKFQGCYGFLENRANLLSVCQKSGGGGGGGGGSPLEKNWMDLAKKLVGELCIGDKVISTGQVWKGNITGSEK